MLNLHDGRAVDQHGQRAAAPRASRKAKADGKGLACKYGADDGAPMRQQRALGEAEFREGLFRSGCDKFCERLAASSLSCWRPLLRRRLLRPPARRVRLARLL